MARARLLKPGFFTNEDLLELPAVVRLLFAGLWTIADREGRLEDRPKRIKIELLPGDDVDVDEALDALAEKGFLTRYAVDGKRYIQIVNFAKHQRPHVKEAASTIPAPTEHQPRSVLAPTKDSASTSCYLNLDTLTLNQKPYAEAVEGRQAPASTASVLENEVFIATLKKRFPDSDVEFELRENWARHVERKPPKDYHRSAINWMKNEVKFGKEERNGKPQGRYQQAASLNGPNLDAWRD